MSSLTHEDYDALMLLEEMKAHYNQYCRVCQNFCLDEPQISPVRHYTNCLKFGLFEKDDEIL